MGDKYISSTHIQKLGHKIQEIRERALRNIVSKLDNGVIFDNDLARSKELLSKLFKWFLLEPCTQEEVVFSLLKRILQSNTGTTLINHLGSQSLIEELDQIRSYIEPQYFKDLDELAKIIRVVQTVVPPLESDIPLSYRSNAISNVYIGTTATTIEGFIKKSASIEQQGCQTGTENSTHAGDNPTYLQKGRCAENVYCSVNNLPNYFFKWQPLIAPDRHVLDSIRSSLAAPPQPAALLHSCEFFVNVLLRDFPAEIFLQRPAIIKEFYDLINCGSTRITNVVLYNLLELTRALCTRIEHCNDVSMKNTKLEHMYDMNVYPNTPLWSTNRSSCNGKSSPDCSDKFESPEETLSLQKRQISTPCYCFITVKEIFQFLMGKKNITRDNKAKINQNAINLCLFLLEELLRLMCLTIKSGIWDQKQTELTLEVLKYVNEILVQYGETLDYFRLESLTCEKNIKYRAIYLYLLHNCAKLLKMLVPLSSTVLILPINLKIALANCLIDVTLARLYPEVYNLILVYVESFSFESGMDPLKKYKDVEKICNGMTSMVKFLKEHRHLSILENLSLAKETLPSVEFHKSLEFLRTFIDLCSEKLDDRLDVEDILLPLLSHIDNDVRQETYRLCHRKVINNLGPRTNLSSSCTPGNEVLFLLSSNILVEIAAFGMTSKNSEIQRYAEEILTYLLKSRMVISDSVWNAIMEALIPSLPIITCHISKNTTLGKTLMSLMDPDNAKGVLLPELIMFKCNVQFLFCDDAYLREEAFSRICWVLSSQDNARELLPKINSLYDSALSNVCRSKMMVDVNKMRRAEHFYQPSSVHQVMDVLNSQNVEPVIKRSALNQVSVMMEDPLLHQIFIDSDGLQSITNIMKTALTENDYRDYPDSIIPIISILKNLSFYHGSVREELSLNLDIFYCVLRGLFLFFTEERLKKDATTLLFILIFKDFIHGNPSKADVTLPAVVIDKMCLPFQCGTHWKQSPYSPEVLKEVISSDRWCLSSVQIQWNCEIFGGFDELMKWKEINYDNQFSCGFVDLLKLSQYDLECIKMSSINFCLRWFLNLIQNGMCHRTVLESIDHLSLYVLLYKISREFSNKQDDTTFLSHPWETSFSRFIGALPSSEEDLILLKKVVNLFSLLIPFYTSTEKCWVVHFLKDPTQCLLDLISIDNTTEETTKILGQELLRLITICIRKEQHYLDFYVPCMEVAIVASQWTHVIKIISDNLKFSEEQHFYNLAYLDSLLSCLVHLTATLGWSGQKSNSVLNPSISDLLSGLCELLCAFHSGKGTSAAVSVMGLSITRNVLLVLNHLLAEMRYSKVKCWETYFFGDVETGSILKNFLALWASRDVVLRAAALQFFSGLSVSSRAALEIVNEVKIDDTSIWELAFTVINDHTEASIVRENAIQLLANMASHMTTLIDEKASNTNLTSFKKSGTMEIFNLLEEYKFYSHLDVLLHNVFTLNVNGKRKYKLPEGLNYYLNSAGSEKSWISSSDNAEEETLVTTPALVKAVANFLLNILNLNSAEVSGKMQEHGLVKLLFRALCNSSMGIENTKELSLYCDILEMNTAICLALNKLASSNSTCLGTILHTKDCFNVLLSLLNSKIYHTGLPQLLYLRNRLWSEIFNLLSSLLLYSGGSEGNLTSRSLEAVSIFSGTLFVLGSEPFFETLSEAVSYMGSKDLQNSALNSLTCLLHVETYRILEEEKSSHLNFYSSSLQTLLDSVRTSRKVIISDVKENIMSSKMNKETSFRVPTEESRVNLLEETYFGKVFQTRNGKDVSEDVEVSFVENEGSGPVCGAELCKILCYLYDVCNIKSNKDPKFNKKKTMVTVALSGLLCISSEAKKFALKNGFLLVVIKQLKEYHIKLSLESVDCLRRAADKKRICPVLKQVNDLINLLNNFMLNNNSGKAEAATLNLADIVHKLWIWFLVQSEYIIEVLRMLSTYTDNCNLACRTLPLTSSVAGQGPRKSPSNVSLLHAIITLVNKRMELISKTHDSGVLESALNLLHNSCESLECRILISKSNLFQSVSRLHPAITKRQKPWEDIEWFWLDFLHTFSSYPEGQTSIAKIPDMLELIMTLANSSRVPNRVMAMMILRNLAFYQPNKARLLSSSDFLNILCTKLTSGSYEEKNIVVVIMWALAANNQRAKIVLKSAHLDIKLENVIKQFQLLNNEEICITGVKLNRFLYILNMLTDDKIK